jgi:hypothetical protein
LPQWSHIVEDPQRSAKGRRNKVIAVNNQVPNRSRWQIELQGLPMVAIIEGNVDAGFGASVQEAFANGVCANHPDYSVARESGDDKLPGVATVPRSEYVGCRFLADVYRSIGGASIVGRCLEVANEGPGCRAEL